MADLQSRPYKPDPAACCEACVFGRGKHAEWCPETFNSLVAWLIAHRVSNRVCSEWLAVSGCFPSVCDAQRK
jgi:DNA gyrase inhibitor GyrI